MVNHTENVARRKLGITSEEWAIGAWEKIGPDAVLLKGGVSKIITKGPRKGRRTWDSLPDKVIVTDAEEVAERVRYEAETGKCADCEGGQAWFGWSRDTGAHYKPCPRCNGTGSSVKP